MGRGRVGNKPQPARHAASSTLQSPNAPRGAGPHEGNSTESSSSRRRLRPERSKLPKPSPFFVLLSYQPPLGQLPDPDRPFHLSRLVVCPSPKWGNKAPMSLLHTLYGSMSGRHPTAQGKALSRR